MKPVILNSILLFLISACCKEVGMEKTTTYKYVDLKVDVPINKINEEQLPIALLKNFSVWVSFKTATIADTMVSGKGCSGSGKHYAPSPILIDPIQRIDLFSNRPFDDAHPAGKSLNSFLYYPDDTNLELPKNIEVLNHGSGKKNISSLLLIGAPDTIKGLTLFEWVFTKRSGTVLKDSTWIVLE